ncbi:OsmC-related (seleno)protein [Aestuariibius sp. 2305UL40-4]|uniref:OsmC-related (seleno)protein n=1 Tax=Aestuariibius violaceus TaxID=3234132 RepID=UPI00345E131A
MPARAEVAFICRGKATGRMRNELDVTMVKPFEERFTLASDEGAFHGGDGSAPPPLALFIAGLTGCLMTQIRAFAKRLGVTVTALDVECRVVWDWAKSGRIYETRPKSFDIDVLLDSPDPLENQRALIEAAKKGCFLEQTLGQANTIRHRLKVDSGFIDA